MAKVLWKREAHTAAKHELLRAFFNKWVSVHSGHFAKRPNGGLVRIHDGFAGPGLYEGGEPGSPLILLDALDKNPNLRGPWTRVRYDFHFVEKDPARAAKLDETLTEFEALARSGSSGWAENVRWTVTPGNYEDHVPEPVNEPSALFLFLDPFGYSHSPMMLTKQLVQQPKSDTLIFLPLSFVNRFKDREGQEVALDRFFGTPDWRSINDGTNRPAALLALFQTQLQLVGLSYTGAFRLEPDRRNEYYIVGASGHESGWASIKEGFWAVDPVHGSSYRTPPPIAPGQQSLDFVEPAQPAANTEALLQALRETFGHKPFTVEEAMGATSRSRFLDSHLKMRTLRPAEQSGALVVTRPPGARQFKEGKGIIMRFA